MTEIHGNTPEYSSEVTAEESGEISVGTWADNSDNSSLSSLVSSCLPVKVPGRNLGGGLLLMEAIRVITYKALLPPRTQFLSPK